MKKDDAHLIKRLAFLFITFSTPSEHLAVPANARLLLCYARSCFTSYIPKRLFTTLPVSLRGQTYDPFCQLPPGDETRRTSHVMRRHRPAPQW
ncbi:unnamed protein product [Schistocephalus solidus]|uniref:Secreted protein n=1 Tax=Schistocephalus solidus TaxID=70667 RepID=A0A183SK89_SCHSO|nr:unnamed protein product [Schistocephalus solidus]